MDYMATVKEFIIENFLFGDGTNLEDNSSFFENGIIDSTGILELISFLEKKFNINVRDDELSQENFDSITKVTAFLERKIAAEQSNA